MSNKQTDLNSKYRYIEIHGGMIFRDDEIDSGLVEDETFEEEEENDKN